MARRLYVEVVIRCDLDDLWRRTQEPHQHQRGDVRFTRIEWLPGSCPGRFRIDVGVTNQRFGPLFGYRDTFTAAYAACRDVPGR